jgi:hypothetical protein
MSALKTRRPVLTGGFFKGTGFSPGACDPAAVVLAEFHLWMTNEGLGLSEISFPGDKRWQQISTFHSGREREQGDELPM